MTDTFTKKHNGMDSIHFGAGKIGRGFIGAVLSKAGYKVCFADVNKGLVDLINTEGHYDVHVMDETSYVETITGVSAVDSTTPECIERFVGTDLVTTAVSMKVLPLIAPTVAEGLKRRCEAGVREPLNIICCENGIRATSQLKAFVYEHLDNAMKTWADEHIAFCDSGVDRIVPPISFEAPLDVAVEQFFEWNVDSTQVKGGLPAIEGLHLTDDLPAHIERKLFTVNTGHCSTAFLGNLKGYTYISEALADPEILGRVREVLAQSGAALISKFGFDPATHHDYSETVLRRFRNPYLKDLVSRVGHDPRRKLGPTLYFSYPISMALSQGLPYDKIALAAGAGLNVDIEGDPQCSEIRDLIASEGLEGAIVSITGQTAPEVIAAISEAYRQFKK